MENYKTLRIRTGRTATSEWNVKQENPQSDVAKRVRFARKIFDVTKVSDAAKNYGTLQNLRDIGYKNVAQYNIWVKPRLVNSVPAKRGSQRFLRLVRIDFCYRFATMNRGGINHRQIKMVNLTYHWHVYVIISPWNIIELCRTFRRDITAKKQQLVTLKVKNLRNNRQKINNFEFRRQLPTMVGMWLQAFILTVI